MCCNYLIANNMKRNRVTILKRISVLGFLITLLYLCLQVAVYHEISIESREDHLKKSNISIIDLLMHRNVVHTRGNTSGIHLFAPVSNITGENHQQESNPTSDFYLLDSIPTIIKALNSADNESVYIDWHDYEKIQLESKRTGHGEHGAAVVLTNEEHVRDKDTFPLDGFSGVSSDKISLDRAVNDLRPPGCKSKKYLNYLPQASVIIIFIDEYWTTLLRTVHSVVNRSPKSLLAEVILVDDFSSRGKYNWEAEYLKQNIEDYMKKTFGKLVRILRNSKREGLIRTRLYGAREAKSDVFVFLESHVEVSVNWLPPLLEPIATKNRTCACPTLDQIKNQDFQIIAQDQGARGAFNWRLEYKRLPRLKYSIDHPTEPFASPVMSGGLFAIGKAFFWELGGYDAGLDIWGAEQYELSFKIWQCHGEMVDVPCSRVAHVYRGYRKESPHREFGNFISRNMKRVAVVWMDEYAEYVYQRWPSVRNIDPGDITEMVELRKRLQCKPFKWFLEEIAFDLLPKYPPIQLPPYASGQIRNKNSSLCIDASYAQDNKPNMKTCQTKSNHVQRFEFSLHCDIRLSGANRLCLDANLGTIVIMYACYELGAGQCWRYDENTQQIRSCSSSRCLDIVGSEIVYTHCNRNESQKWFLENFSLGAYKAIIENNSTSCS